MCSYYTIAYQFCRAKEIRGLVFSFTYSALEEGKWSGINNSYFLPLRGRGKRKSEREIKIKLATSVLLILDHTCFM